MSFLIRTAPSLFRATRTSTAFAPRAFSISFVARKSATEAVKDTVKMVNRKVSDKIVDGIEIGQIATKKVKGVTGMPKGEAQGKASELAGEAKGKAHELAGEVKGKKEELKGKL